MQQCRMHTVEPGSFADRAHPSMRDATIESVAVAAPQDRTVVALTDCEVDRTLSSRLRWSGCDRALAIITHTIIHTLHGEAPRVS
jgi:hypothetical protein